MEDPLPAPFHGTHRQGIVESIGWLNRTPSPRVYANAASQSGGFPGLRSQYNRSALLPKDGAVENQRRCYEILAIAKADFKASIRQTRLQNGIGNGLQGAFRGFKG